MKSLSMKTRMALAVSLLFVLFSVTIAYFSIAYMEGRYKKSLADQQYALVSAIADCIDNKIIMLQRGLLAAGSQVPPEIIGDAERARRFLDERVTLHALFDTTLFLLDKDGKLIAESPRLPERRVFNLAHRDYYRKTVTTGKPAISSPYKSSLPDQRPVVMFTAPIFDSQGRLSCILCGGMRLMGENLLSEVAGMKLGAAGYLYLTTTDRTMIMHPDKARIMAPAVPPGRNRMFDRAMAGFDGSGETVNSRDIKMLVSFQHLRATDWVLAVNFPLSEAYAPMYRTRQYLLGGIGAGTVAILAIAWLVMRRLTLPLVTVTRQVEAMGEGTGRLELLNSGSADEIGTLTAAFNRLIGKLHRQQEILRENEQKYRIVADNTYDWEFWLDPEHRFLYSSPSCKRITGIDATEFLANPELLLTVIHPDDRRTFRDHRDQVRAEHALYAVEFRIVHAEDGSVRWVSHLCQPVYDDEGKYRGTRGSNSDVTARKRAEEKIMTLNSDLACRVTELETANSELEAFSYTVSHDLRTPLTHISLCCQVLADLLNKSDEERCKGCLEEIFLATQNMDQLITSLLDFSHVSRCELHWEVVKLSDLAKMVAAELQINQPDRRVIFTITEGITVHGDAYLLRVVLANLLGNAWKYTGKRETAVIEFGVTEAEGERTFFVRDNGEGFAMSQSKELFGVFQRLPGSKEFPGHGIGLATVQRIINRHGGRVWAVGEEGSGATFYFTLNSG
jgi:PAS domain S-box-containing protein